MPISRRDILESLTGVCAAPFFVSRAEAQVTPEIARFHPEIEPLVALIETTPREKCAEMFVEKLRSGVSYRQLLAALFLAGVRNVNPRPPGFALHCVFVIYSAHLIALEAPAESRLLPLFYAVDNFKAAQERDVRAGDFILRPINGPLYSSERAAAEFTAGMESWDAERAERAVASLIQYRSAAEVFEMLWRYAVRDYRNIGHKAIFAANAQRTLQVIGWQHAEPVLRSLVLILLDFGKERRVSGYAFEDQSYLANLKRSQAALPALSDASADKSAAAGIVDALRTGSVEDACAYVAAGLEKRKISAASVWDAVHLGAAELSMSVRERAVITGLHAVTAANALHYSYLAALDAKTRLLTLLQAVGWVGQFRAWAGAREGDVRAFSILKMESHDNPAETGPAFAEIFDRVPTDLDLAAGRVFDLAASLPKRQAFVSTALRMTLAKADEVHYYKYLAAIIEDLPLMSPTWQPHLLAATVYYTKGSKDPAAPVMKRAQEALRVV